MTKVTRGTRIKWIQQLDWLCPVCHQVTLNSRAWVVRDDVVMCKSCWTKILAYINYNTALLEGVHVDWLKTCNEPTPDCNCRHCVLKRLKP